MKNLLINNGTQLSATLQSRGHLFHQLLRSRKTPHQYQEKTNKEVFIMKSSISTAILGLCYLLGLPHAATAGTVLIMKTQSDGQETNAETLFEKGVLRMDSWHQGQKNSFIFDSNKKALVMVNHQDKTYTTFDETTLKEITERMQGFKKQMEAQLANLPPEQRQMMQQMMQGRMPSTERPKANYELKQTGETQNIAGISCQLMNATKDGQLMSELCVADSSKIPNGEQLYTAFKALQQMFAQLMEAMPIRSEVMDEAWHAMQTIPGYPILIRQIKNGRVSSTSELVKVKEQAIDMGKMKIPEGYREQKISLR